MDSHAIHYFVTSKITDVHKLMFCFQYPPKSHDEINTTLGNISKGAADMVLKLLETNQQFRLKSLHQIKIQSFFHNFNFSDVTLKKVCTVSKVFFFEVS